VSFENAVKYARDVAKKEGLLGRYQLRSKPYSAFRVGIQKTKWQKYSYYPVGDTGERVV